MFTEAKRTHLGHWLVKCTDCGNSLGTMTGKSLTAAMLFGLSREGIKCPRCREISCPRCHYANCSGVLCTICEMEENEIKKTSVIAHV
jgi:hypothetical protein